MAKLTILAISAVAGLTGVFMAMGFTGPDLMQPAGSDAQVWGDIDCDGDVNGGDAIAALREAADLAALPQGGQCPLIGSPFGDETDSTHFQIHFTNEGVGHIVYCGAVHSNAHPYVLDVSTSNAPELTDPDNPNSPPKPGHDGAGWLLVLMQNGIETTFNVPNNSSFAFDLHPEGTAGVDQLIQISSPPKGNESGGGASFAGFASVQAAAGAIDPFTGDGVDDNFCVTIGVAGEVPAEFVEGDISTTLPVLDGWVLDGDGSDGGVLRGVPH